MSKPTASILTSLHGRRFGLGPDNELVVNKDGSGGSATAQADVLSIARKQLTTAEVLALFTTPIEVIAAPGAGKAILVHRMVAAMDYNTTAYVGGAGEDLTLTYTDASGLALTAPLDDSGFIEAAADAIAYAPGVGVSSQGIELTQNAAVMAFMQVGNVATGDSAVDLTVYYEVLALADFFI